MRQTLMDFQAVSLDVLREKYAKGEEQKLAGAAMADAIRRRVAGALAGIETQPEHWRTEFLRALRQGFIPAGRINSAAGAEIRNVTLINCFVQPVGDSVSECVDDKPGIYTALLEAAETMRRGGGVGYDFSPIRPAGAKVKGTASSASGPVSYMHVFNQSCATVESAGARRGAQMGVLRIDHPDIFQFVQAKQQAGSLSNFNLSVGVTDAFMAALEAGDEFELVHPAEPSEAQIRAGARRRDDGLWVYRRVDPQELWDIIMRSTYQAAEPGVLFLDRINAENNLAYCEHIDAVNPCGEQCLPAYGCCCLGSIDLTRFVSDPFSDQAGFDQEGFRDTVGTAVRMLDNVLDLSAWPLPQQRREAMDKRRVGLGFTGLGDALIMLGLKYDSEPARRQAAGITRLLRDTAYEASIGLAREKGPFPLFEAEPYLASPFAQRLPEDLRDAIRVNGIRNSHLLSIAPTGTISLAFADNCSNGIEPAFSWYYTRKKREADGGSTDYRVEDHAYRRYRESGHDPSALPEAFVNALEISARDHMLMQAAIQPCIDASISKTVNVPENYPFAQFQHLYRDAWKAGLKGITTYRPNNIVGSVLTVAAETKAQDLDQSEPDRKIRITETPEQVLESLRWPKRPRTPAGTPGVTYLLDCPGHRFAVFIGHFVNSSQQPFEVWVNGEEQPRGLAALAKNLSMDMRAYDRDWLRIKLDSLSKTAGQPFQMAMPPDGRLVHVPGNVAALARLIRYRCDELGIFDHPPEKTPLVDALFSRKEPKSGTDGTLSWTVDICNPSTGDDFALFLKECVMPDGSHRPYSVWLSGTFPPDFNGLTKSLSLDMRVLDTAWIGKKLRGLKHMPEPQGDFFARVPGQARQEIQPSTVAYIARLLIHRYFRLGILDAEGFPIHPLGMLETAPEATEIRPENQPVAGKPCPECGQAAVIRKDGCDFCTACGYLGACG